MTGMQIQAAGNTHKGSAKPDDPVYKEGWHIHLPKSAPKSNEPSKSTPPKQA